MNPFENQRIVGGASLVSFAVAILCANASGTAAPNSDSSRSLPSKLPTPAAIVIRNNPFLAFTIPHAQAAINGGAGQIAGNFVPGRNQIINAPGRPGQYVPGPGGVLPNAAPAEVVLCDTWTATPGTNQTPTAVFMVGRSSVIASAGDWVGGYRVARIADGIVHFDGDDSLALGDCRSLDASTTATGDDTTDDDAADEAAPAAMPPLLPPGARITTSRPQPQGAIPLPGGAVRLPTAAATAAPYDANNDDNDYGSTIYGKPAPSSPPYPIAIPNGR